MSEVLKRIEAARTRALDVGASVSRYTRGDNGLDACFPTWVLEGGTDKEMERLKDPAQRARIKKEMDEPATQWENQWRGASGGEGIMLIQVINPELRKYEGMNLNEIGRQMGKDPRDAAMDIDIADHGNSQIAIAVMQETDVRAPVSNPLVTYRSASS